MITKEEFEKGYREYVGKDQTFWLLEDCGVTITNGVKYVIEKLDAWFIIPFVMRAVMTPSVMQMRLKHGYKNLLIMNVTDEGCLLTLHIAEKEMVRMEIKDRPDLPKVRVVMIMGCEVVYLLNED